MFGSFDRRLGLLLSVNLALVYLAVRIWFAGERTLARLLRWLAGAGIVISAYALLQVFSIDVPKLRDPFPLLSAPGWFRTVGTLGHPDFLGTFLVCTLPLSVHFAAIARGRVRAAWAVGAALMVVALASTFSRGAWLGALAAGAVLLIRAAHRRRAALFALLLALALIPFLPAIAGRLDASGANTDSAQARLVGWSAATRAIMERPLIGWGSEGYMAYTERHMDPANPDYPFAQDRAHNLFLDAALASGLPGLALTVAVIILALCAFIRSRSALAIALTAAAVGYLVQGQFVFNTVGTCAIPVLLLAVAANLSERPTFASLADFLPRGNDAPNGIPAALVAAGLIVIILAHVPPSAAGVYALNAIHEAQAQNIPATVHDLTRAAALDPFQTEYRVYLKQYMPPR